MLAVNQAIRKAEEYFTELYKSKFLQFETLSNLRVEEAELTDDERYWLITFGFDTPGQALPDSLASQSGLPNSARLTARDYKIVKIDAEYGRFRSLRIREIRRA